MPMFKKKPVVIEANQFDGTLAAKKMLEDDFGVTTVDATTYDGKLLNWHIGTLEGPHEVTPGDWIIRGVKGEFYPCKPDIFEMTYELKDECWRLTAANAALKSALQDFDALIKHQYSGTQEAMSDLTYAAQQAARVLKGEKP